MRDRLLTAYQTKNSLLCVGLDPDPAEIPACFSPDLHGIRDFLETVIEQTRAKVICYKPNISFFEGLGIDGLALLKDVVGMIDEPVIIDAKRGDIGNTSAMQARFIFEHLGADATTLHPYMGLDSLKPFFEYSDKFNFVLGLTSNPSAADFELLNGLFQTVMTKLSDWNKTYGNVGAVVGATQCDHLATCRTIDPDLLFLMPGVGAQGASYSDAAIAGQAADGLAVVNVGRAITYPIQTDSKSEFKAAISTALETHLLAAP